MGALGFFGGRRAGACRKRAVVQNKKRRSAPIGSSIFDPLHVHTSRAGQPMLHRNGAQPLKMRANKQWYEYIPIGIDGVNRILHTLTTQMNWRLRQSLGCTLAAAKSWRSCIGWHSPHHHPDAEPGKDG
jgi:hypothetical protein